MADLKEALKGDDAEAITAKTNALAQASMKLGEAMYKQAQEARAAPGGPVARLRWRAAGKKEDVVDAEFTEVDDDKKNKSRPDAREAVDASAIPPSARTCPPGGPACDVRAAGRSFRRARMVDDWRRSGDAMSGDGGWPSADYYEVLGVERTAGDAS